MHNLLKILEEALLNNLIPAENSESAASGKSQKLMSLPIRMDVMTVAILDTDVYI